MTNTSYYDYTANVRDIMIHTDAVMEADFTQRVNSNTKGLF